MLAEDAKELTKKFEQHSDVFREIKKCAARGETEYTTTTTVDFSYLESLGYKIAYESINDFRDHTVITTISWE